MTEEPRPKAPDDKAPQGDDNPRTDNQQPLPDGEAIAEIGDAVGGPA
jgi:hypothetical protein